MLYALVDENEPAMSWMNKNEYWVRDSWNNIQSLSLIIPLSTIIYTWRIYYSSS